MGVMTTSVVVVWMLMMVAVQDSLGQPQFDRSQCDQASDIVFVLDVSSSIGNTGFKLMRDFVIDVTSELDVGSGDLQTRVAAVTFSTGVNFEFSLGKYLDRASLLEGINEIYLRGGNTNTHKALQLVKQDVFNASMGARPLGQVSRIVIVITDGASRKAQLTREAAQAVRDTGATVYAIGVKTNEEDSRQLRDLASSPKDQHLFQVQNFHRLSELKDILVKKACQTTTTTTPSTTTITTTTTTPPTTTTTTTPTPTTSELPFNDQPSDQEEPEACVSLPADVYFVLDSSSSIYPPDFKQNVISFVSDVIQLYDIGWDLTHVGVITFSDTAHKVFGLNKFIHKDKLVEAVATRIQYIPGSTNTTQALRMADEQMAIEGRDGVQQIILLITDGQSTDPTATISTARAVRGRGVRVLAVGVGDNVDEGELEAVQGAAEGAVMRVGDFQSLALHSRRLAARSCAPQGSVPWNPEWGMTSPRPYRCSLGQADIVVTYDWAPLGSVAVSHLTSALPHLFSSLTLRGADVTMGIVTSKPCVNTGKRKLHTVVPLSSVQVLEKYSHSYVIRPQLHRLMKSVHEDAFTPDNGFRGAAVRKVVVVVLDEANMATVRRQMIRESNNMRRVGVDVFLVTSGSGGDDADKSALWQEFQLPAPSHVIRLPRLDFSDSRLISASIARALCGDY